MIPYFIWRGVDSREMGVYVTQLPPPAKPEERAKSVEIPGRAGAVTLKEGEDIYKPYVRPCVITAPDTADMTAILQWLRGAGIAVFSNEPDRAYDAQIVAEVTLDKLSNSLRQATVQFLTQPYKHQHPAEDDITLGGTLTNPGNVTAAPLIILSGSGSVTVAVGAYSMAFSGLSGTLTIDCDAEIITDQNGEIWRGEWVGKYIKIPAGSHQSTVSGEATATMTPRWRYV